MTKSYYIETMGCQMNEYDSEHLARIFEASGCRPAADPEQADFIIVNTCTVRAKAEQKALSRLGRLTALKRTKKGLLIGAAGCLAQQKGRELLERFAGLDFVLGPREIGGFKALLGKLERGAKKVACTSIQCLPKPFAGGFDYYKGRVKAYMTIMEGCNNFCSYCIVPYVRGREVSRPLEEILEEARNLTLQGIKEITLLGQNVNSYKHKKTTFPQLLRAMDQIQGLHRIRFTTSHPKDLSQELIRCFEDLEKLCPHIHLPFQAGSNRILRAMKRGYTREEYLDLIRSLRIARPDIAVTSDVMVGFPGETEEDFESTLDLIHTVEFDNLFSFRYSDRPGTPSSRLAGKISEQEKQARLARLQEEQKAVTLKKNKRLIGKELKVLVEGSSKKGQQFTGRTESNKVVNFNCNNNKLTDLVNVVIKRVSFNSLWGEML